MEENCVPESVLQRLEKGSNRLAVSVRDYRTARTGEDAVEKDRAMRALGITYLLSGREIECGLTPEEADGLSGVAAGAGYKETARVDANAEAKARNEQTASIFREEEKAWKARR